MARLTARYLADKSALARIRHPEVAKQLAPLIENGEIATCGIVELEVLFSARSHNDLLRTARRRRVAYEWVETSESTIQRALEVQEMLARTGHHRVPIPDLLIAATAEAADLTVLHYDKDFDVIAEATGQACEWVVPRGTVG